MKRSGHRLFIRFSMRTTLVLVTVFCMGIAWKVDTVNKQKRVVAWTRNHGYVRYDYEVDETGPPGPGWLREWIGIDYFATVTEVHLCDGTATSLSPLRNLRKLRKLDTFCSEWKTDVTDLTPLENLTSLQELRLGSSQVVDVEPLASLTNLEFLELHSTPVNDVSPLASLANLKCLDLQCTRVSAAAASDLQKALPNCRIIR